jgi:hypothetical protein
MNNRFLRTALLVLTSFSPIIADDEYKIEFQGCGESSSGIKVIGSNVDLSVKCINENCPEATIIRKEGKNLLVSIRASFKERPIYIYLPNKTKLVCVKNITVYRDNTLTARLLVRQLTPDDDPLRYSFIGFDGIAKPFTVPEIYIEETSMR